VLIAGLPDFGSLEGTAFLSTLFGLAFTAGAHKRGADRDDIQWAGFEGASYGAGLGIAIWLFGLLTRLY
jgi:hypothetical protein